MTTLSTRYATPLLATLAPALLAVWAYSYGGFRSDDCADSSALLETAWIEGMKDVEEPDAETPGWLFQSTGGTVATKAPRISGLKFRILRSFEPERLYGDPLKFLPKPRDFASSGTTLEWLGSEGDALPIHEVVAEAPGATRIGAYMFLYGPRPVADPSLALLSTAFLRIATGPRPLTLVTVSLYSSSRLRDAAERLAEEWLVSAWEYHRSVCRE
jgi:hypothetical protein